MLDLASIKKLNKKDKERREKQQKYKKRIIREADLENTPISIFDVNLEQEYNNLSKDVREQFLKTYNIAKKFKQNYIEKNSFKEKNEKMPLKKSDQICMLVDNETQDFGFQEFAQIPKFGKRGRS